MAVKKHAAIIEIGGAVASSFKSVKQTVQGDFGEIGDSIRGLKKQQDMLEKFNPDEVRKAGREYRTLKREADKLERAFKKTANPTREMERDMLKARSAADKAGKSFNAQKERCDKLGDELREMGVNTRAVAMEQKRLASEVDHARKKMEQMKRVNEGILQVGDSFARTRDEAGKLAVGVGATVGAFGAGITLVNAQTAEQQRLAQSLNMSGEAFSSWGGLAREAGQDADIVGDLVEEMTNKLGESKGLGEITPVTESLQMMGLAFKDLENLSPEQQFKTIATAIKGMDDAQAAQSAADILMGGEANKFFGYLRTRKEGVDDLLNQQKKLNLMSDEGRAGALNYSQSMGKLGGVVSSAAGEFSGLVGGVLAPYLEDLAPKIGEMFNEHRDDIKDFGAGIGKALPKIGEFAFGLLGVMNSVGSAISWVADKVGGFGNLAVVVGGIIASKFIISAAGLAQSIWTVGSAVAPIISTALPGLVAGIKAVGMAVMTNPIGLVIGAAVLAVGRLIYAWDELKKSFSEGGIGSAVATFFGFGDDEEAEEKQLASEKTKPVIGKTVAPATNHSPYTMRPVEGAAYPAYAPVQPQQQKMELQKMPLPPAAPAESKQITDKRKITIHVQATPDQHPQAIAEAVHKKYSSESGLLYDSI